MTGSTAAALGAGLLHSWWAATLVVAIGAGCRSAVPSSLPRARLRIAVATLLMAVAAPLWLALLPALPGAPWMTAFCGAWGIGVGLSLLRIWNSHRAVVALRRGARPAGAAWQARLDACARSLGLTSRVALLISSDRDIPCTLGMRRPAVLLPADHLAYLDEQAWRAVVMHELAHVVRRDYAWHVLQAIAAAFGCHHPAVAWLTRVIEREREAACDDVVARYVAADVLATALVTIERRRLRGPSAEARATGLRARVERLVETPAVPGWFSPVAWVVLVCIAVAVTAHAARGTPVAATIVPWLGAAGLGLVIGLRHALEPDHLVAVATLVSRERSIGAAVRLGTSWGTGHTLALLAVGAVLVVARRAMPEGLTDHFELAVGLMLIGMGVQALHRAWRDGLSGPARAHDHAGHVHTHETSGDHLHIGGLTLAARPLAIGLVHGLAGSGALTALAVASLPGWPQQLTFILVFGIGSTLGMALVTGLAGWPLARVMQSPRALPALSGATGLLAVVVGVSWSLPLLAHQLGY